MTEDVFAKQETMIKKVKALNNLQLFTDKNQEEINQCYRRVWGSENKSAVCFGFACKYWEQCLASKEAGDK